MATWKYPKVSSGSLRALAYEIKNGISGGITSDDSKYSIRLIESEIKHQLGLAQKEEDLANEILGIEPNAQRLKIYSCIPLKETNDFYCKCTKSGGKFKKAAIPKMLQWRGQSFIKFLGNTDMDVAFTPMPNILSVNNNQALVNKPTYFLAGNAAYVSLPKDFSLMCDMTVMGIPDDPSDENGLCVDVWNKEWNVSQYMKAIVKLRVMQVFVPSLVSTNQNADLRNNSQDGNQFVTTLTP